MGHWYAKDGSPAHFQPDGKDTTLAHARKQSLRPSVTTILDIVASPGLTNYFISQHLEAAWITNSALGKSEWMRQARETAGEHSKQARDQGSLIHKALEIWYSDSTEPLTPDNFDGLNVTPYLNAVTAALSDVYGIEVGKARSEVTFATEAYGGSVDLVGDNLIIDFKTKSAAWECKKDGTPKKMWYESHIGQLAAYREGLGMPTAKVANVFIGPNAEVYVKEWTEEETQEGWEWFKACLKVWQLKNKWEVQR